MERQEILKRFRALRTWSQGDKRAPHKPLLVLYAMGRLIAGKEPLISFKDLEQDLRSLLVAFGPPRKAHHPEYPFWRLRNDGIWRLTNAENVEARKSNSDAKKSELIKYDVHGGFSPQLNTAFRKDPELCLEVAYELLGAHFPSTIHEDILQAVGIETGLSLSTIKRKRDPAFRERVLSAYEYCCAVCGMDIRLGTIPVGLEAAHIKWHQAGGPDVESNGLALCSLHHKLLDRGVFTITESAQIVVSEQAIGSSGFDSLVLVFHGQFMRVPVRNDFMPKAQFALWHQKEVFHGPGRELESKVW